MNNSKENERAEQLKAILGRKTIVPSDRNQPVTIIENIAHNSKIPLSYDKLMSINFPPDQWVIENLVPSGLTILSAQPGSYKTWLLLDMALAVSQGQEFVGKFQTSKSGVLIVDEENSASILQKRLKMLGNFEELNIHFFIEQGFKLTDNVVARIIKICHEKELSFVTFDSLVRIHDKSENDATQMAEVFRQIRKITKEEISVLVTHHNRKSGSDDNPSQAMRGSSDILASVDCHLALKRISGSNILNLTQTKVRTSAELEPFDIDVEYNETSMTFAYLSSQATTTSMRTDTAESIIAVLHDDAKMNQKQIAEALEDNDRGIGMKSLRPILNSLISKGIIVATRGRGKEILYEMVKSEKV